MDDGAHMLEKTQGGFRPGNRLTPTHQVAAPQDDPDDEIDLLALAGALWRGKWIIAACALVLMLIGG